MTAITPIHRFIIGNTTNVDRVGTTPIDAEWAAGIPVSGRWRWSQRRNAWFGPAYAVSWSSGDNVGVPTGPWPGLGFGAIQCVAMPGGTPWDLYPHNTSVPGAPRYEFDELGDLTAVAATTTETGVIFIVQQATGLPSTSATAPPIDLDVLDYLGDAVLTNGTTVVTYADDLGDGDDGDGFIEWNARNLYERGVDNPGIWYLWGCIASPPHQILMESTDAGTPVIQGYGLYGSSGADPINDADLFQFFAGTGIGSGPPGTRGRPNGTLILMGDLPDDSVLSNGQMALWLDPTPSAAKLMIKAKDSAGTVVAGNVPLT